MTLDCPIKNKEMRSHPEKSATLLELSLFNYMIMNKFFQLFQFPAKMIIQRNNKETLQFLKQIECEKMILTTLVDEVTCFFGAVKTKRSNTVKSKIANYVKKEDQLRKSIFSKSARKVVVWSGKQNCAEMSKIFISVKKR